MIISELIVSVYYNWWITKSFFAGRRRRDKFRKDIKSTRTYEVQKMALCVFTWRIFLSNKKREFTR